MTDHTDTDTDDELDTELDLPEGIESADGLPDPSAVYGSSTPPAIGEPAEISDIPRSLSLGEARERFAESMNRVLGEKAEELGLPWNPELATEAADKAAQRLAEKQHEEAKRRAPAAAETGTKVGEPTLFPTHEGEVPVPLAKSKASSPKEAHEEIREKFEERTGTAMVSPTFEECLICHADVPFAYYYRLPTPVAEGKIGAIPPHDTDGGSLGWSGTATTDGTEYEVFVPCGHAFPRDGLEALSELTDRAIDTTGTGDRVRASGQDMLTALKKNVETIDAHRPKGARRHDDTASEGPQHSEGPHSSDRRAFKPRGSDVPDVSDFEELRPPDPR